MINRAVLTERPVGRLLVVQTLQMMFGIFSMTAYNLADTYFVGKLGTEPLGAMGFTFPVVLVVQSIALGLGMGASSVISRAIGEGDHGKLRRLTTDSLFLAMVIVAVFVTIGLLTINPLFKLLGAENNVMPLIRKYMVIWYIGMPFVVVPMVGNNAMRATGDTRVPAMIMFLGAIINVILDPLIIFGIWIFPRLEIAGAALATVLARMTTFIVTIVILRRRDRMLSFKIPKMRDMWESWKRILYIALPSAGIQVLLPLSMSVMTWIAAWYGTHAVAAVGVGVRVQAFAMIPLISLATVLIPFVGQNWGAGRIDRVILGHKQSYIFSFVWGIVCTIFFLLAGRPVAHAFSGDPAVIKPLLHFLWIVSFGFGAQGIASLAGSSLNAINRPFSAAGINIVRIFILFIPLSYLGAVLYDLDGMFAGILIASILSALVSIFWLYSIFRRAIAQPQNRSETGVIPGIPVE